MRVVLKGEDEVKLDNLNSAMIASRTSDNSSYATWINFNARDGSMSDYVIEAFLAYWMLWVMLLSEQDGFNPYVFPLVILLVKGDTPALPTVLGITLHMAR